MILNKIDSLIDRHSMKLFVFLSIAVVAGFLVAVACTSDQRQKTSNEIQKEQVTNAFDAVPAYQPNEFSIREDINWHLRETEGRYTWYVYALNYVGEPLFYVVSDVRPTSVCVNLTAADYRDTGSSGAVALTAPSLNGVYRKSGACNTIFLRDATTGGLIEISGTAFTLVSSKQPLFIETDIRRLDGGGGSD